MYICLLFPTFQRHPLCLASGYQVSSFFTLKMEAASTHRILIPVLHGITSHKTISLTFTTTGTSNHRILPYFLVANIVALNVPMPQLCQRWRPYDKQLSRGERPHCHIEGRPCGPLWLGSYRQLWAWSTESCWSFSHNTKHILCCRLQVFNHSCVL
jgi:hypothetical protein